MKRIFLLFLVILPLLSACASNTVTYVDFIMDTVITYTVDSPSAEEIIAKSGTLTRDSDRTYSAYTENSAVSVFNTSGELSGVDFLYLEDIIPICDTLYKESNGAFDITVAPLVKLWNITHSTDGWTPPSDEAVAAVLPHVGFDKLEIGANYIKKTDEVSEIDLGGIAKGYTLGNLIDNIRAYYPDATGTVSFGGNIALIGEKSDGKPWTVGIKDPFDTWNLIGTLTLESGMVAVSGGYERFAEYDGVRYHHIIDPKTGYPAETDIASAAVWVKDADARSGAFCDGLSTALFVMGHDAALELYRAASSGESDIPPFEAVIIKTDGTVTVTNGLTERYAPYVYE